ncbi:hypothetical protein CEXT_781271 [Caerostris extrusa]|uniref:Uncharacterized protein n=1 Tax=Caerostris extrusa TaxID=172846 RepID=A0AAV4WPS5_CAEEX|nr:hypothetical protein CEXT_781271 [Caerostris extrusa]
MQKKRIEVSGGGMENLQTTSNTGLSRNTYKELCIIPPPIAEDSSDIKSLKQIVCKASILNAKIPAKEDIGVLKRRVVAGEKVRPDRILPKFRGQCNHSNFFNVHPTQLTRKQLKERKMDPYYDDFQSRAVI